MSYIDSFKHDHVGFIAGVPIYLPLQQIAGDEFQADESSIVLGGGSGELAGYVLTPGDVIFSAIDSHFMSRDGSQEFPAIAQVALQLEGLTEEDYESFLEELFPSDDWEPSYPEWTGDEWYTIITAAIAEGFDVEARNYLGKSILNWLEAKVGEKMLNEYFDRVTAGLSPKALKIIEIGAMLNPNLHPGADARALTRLAEEG